MSAHRLQYLAELGIPAWELRRRGETETAPGDAAAGRERTGPAGAGPTGPRAEGVAAGGDAAPAAVGRAEADVWRALAAEVRDCRRCALHEGRRQAVFGVGRQDAQLLIVGEAPGEEEDRQGEPFVGRAGRLLNQMLRAIGFRREQVYIANILKCRPPRNRDPRPEEAAECSGYLDRQIALIGPRAMLAVGRISAQHLLQTDANIGKLRGRVHRYGEAGIPLVVTYHPAYLLRQPGEKAKSWQDLCMLVPLLETP